MPPSVHLYQRCSHAQPSLFSVLMFSTLCSRVLIEISRDLNGAQMLYKRPHRSNRCSPSLLDHLAAAVVLCECCSTVTAIRAPASSRALPEPTTATYSLGRIHKRPATSAAASVQQETEPRETGREQADQAMIPQMGSSH